MVYFEFKPSQDSPQAPGSALEGTPCSVLSHALALRLSADDSGFFLVATDTRANMNYLRK